MERYAEKDIVKILQNNSVELFDALKYNDKNMYIPFIEKVCRKEQCDYFDLAYHALNNNADNWSLGNILIDLIPYTIIDINNILKFYKLFHIKRDGTSQHFNITKSLVLNNHTLAKKLLERLVTIDDAFVIPHISAILIELHNSSNESQYKTITDYLKSSDIIILECLYWHIF